MPLWKKFTIDELPEAIDPSGPVSLVVRTDFKVNHVIVKERHETIMGYKPRERVALEWFIAIIVELLVL